MHEEFFKIYEDFFNMVNDKEMFHMSIRSGAVSTGNDETRKNVILEKNIVYNTIYRADVEVGNTKYAVNNIVFDKVINYVKSNFSQLIEVALNQDNKMLDGVCHTINVKIGSMFLTLSPMNVKTEQDKMFLNQFEKTIIDMVLN